MLTHEDYNFYRKFVILCIIAILLFFSLTSYYLMQISVEERWVKLIDFNLTLLTVIVLFLMYSIGKMMGHEEETKLHEEEIRGKTQSEKVQIKEKEIKNFIKR